MFIYLITNLVNGKKYVGQTQHTPEVRWRGHLRHVREGSTLRLHAAIRKYSAQAFIVAVLETGAASVEQLNKQEKFWIAYFDSTNFAKGYNADPGGDARSAASIEKGAAKIRGRIRGPYSVEVKQRMSEGRKGKGCGPRSEAVRKSISETRKARFASGAIKMRDQSGVKSYWFGRDQTRGADGKFALKEARNG